MIIQPCHVKIFAEEMLAAFDNAPAILQALRDQITEKLLEDGARAGFDISKPYIVFSKTGDKERDGFWLQATLTVNPVLSWDLHGGEKDGAQVKPATSYAAIPPGEYVEQSVNGNPLIYRRKGINPGTGRWVYEFTHHRHPTPATSQTNA